MNLSNCETLTLVTIALVMLSNFIVCMPTDDEESFDDENRFKNVNDAVNLMHELVNGQMPLQQRCERYAILLSKADADGVSFDRTVNQLVTADKHILDEYLQNIDIIKYISLFMTAIDRYRTSKLAPGFIDLIECLRQIDSSLVKQYLYDEDLFVIEGLYRQVLAEPAIKFNLDRWKIPNFTRALGSTIKYLFKDNIQEDTPIESEAPVAGTVFEWCSDKAGPSGVQQQPLLSEQSTKKERHRIRSIQRNKERKELLKGKHEQSHWQRERDRLRKRRRRILEPGRVREQERLYKQRRRAQMTEEQRQVMQRVSLQSRIRRRTSYQTSRQRLMRLNMMQDYTQQQQIGEYVEQDPREQSSQEVTPRHWQDSRHLQLPNTVASDTTEQMLVYLQAQPEQMSAVFSSPGAHFDLDYPATEQIRTQAQRQRARPYPPLVAKVSPFTDFSELIDFQPYSMSPLSVSD